MRRSLLFKLGKLTVAVAVLAGFFTLIAPTAHADSLITYTFTITDPNNAYYGDVFTMGPMFGFLLPSTFYTLGSETPGSGIGELFFQAAGGDNYFIRLGGA
jgi:hypothetical protein